VAVWNLRSERSFSVIHAALEEQRRRTDVRAIEFSIQGNHVHLIIEADGPRALSNGMRALGIRLARGRVRQLRGPHLSTWAWWRRRSSAAATAATSPSSFPQSSTGRFEVR
jgi:REP element-mobilizing transposase RayT